MKKKLSVTYLSYSCIIFHGLPTDVNPDPIFLRFNCLFQDYLLNICTYDHYFTSEMTDYWSG